jgi:ribose/xylose/arabinose/galactoside ABC-type transport system permease subunit
MSAAARGISAAPWFTSAVTVVLLLAMLGIGGGAYPGFLSLQVLFNLLIDNAFLLVLAIGMGFVILSGGIDLSVGAVLALSTMVTAWLLQTAHWHPALVIITVLVWARCSAPRWGSSSTCSSCSPSSSRWPACSWRADCAT